MIQALIMVYIGCNIVTPLITDMDVHLYEEFFNPYYIYKTYKVNKIGAAMIMLVAHILFIVPAICYWIYKLCTFGRD